MAPAVCIQINDCDVPSFPNKCDSLQAGNIQLSKAASLKKRLRTWKPEDPATKMEKIEMHSIGKATGHMTACFLTDLQRSNYQQYIKDNRSALQEDSSGA